MVLDSVKRKHDDCLDDDDREIKEILQEKRKVHSGLFRSKSLHDDTAEKKMDYIKNAQKCFKRRLFYIKNKWAKDKSGRKQATIQSTFTSFSLMFIQRHQRA